jgi:hypothetical protein
MLGIYLDFKLSYCKRAIFRIEYEIDTNKTTLQYKWF